MASISLSSLESISLNIFFQFFCGILLILVRCRGTLVARAGIVGVVGVVGIVCAVGAIGTVAALEL